MKKILIILIILLFSANVFAGDYQFYFFGINSKFIQEAKWQQIVIGASASVLTHFAGHIAYGKIIGADVDTQGFWKDTIHNGSPSEVINFSRSGFIAQSAIGLLLTSFEKSRNWDFTRGYVAMSAVEIWSYPIRNQYGGDIENINKYGGDGSLEWTGYSALALHNMLRINYKK